MLLAAGSLECPAQARGGPDGAARDQLRGDQDVPVDREGSGEAVNQQSQGPAADFGEVLSDRGQRRDEVGGFRDVVEADDADVAGDGPAGLVERAQDAESGVVVRAEHRGGLRILRESLPGGVAGLRAPVPPEHGRHLGAGVLQGAPPAGLPLFAVQPARVPGHVVDGSVAEIQQVPSGGRGPGHVVDPDPGQRRRGAGADRDHRDRAGDLGEFPCGGCLRHDDRDPLDTLPAQMLDRLLDGSGVE